MLRLIIGNKAYSSWSLRPWLALRVAGIAFEETVVPLYEQGSSEKIRQFSPTGKVPCLVDGEITVWDSLAILEYVAETYPQAQLWPTSAARRALARSVAAEMHSGFMPLRQNMPMNTRKSLPGKGLPTDAEAKAAVEKDIARIDALWSDLRRAHASEGPFLFGAFSCVDAMFAPVVSRFATYGISLSPEAEQYAQTILALPAMKDWYAAAEQEVWVLPHCEK